MVYNPNRKIVVRVEIKIAGAWVDVTSRGRKASCIVTQGRSPNAIQAETSRLQLTLGNPDAYLTEDNAMSPWYASWGRGCEIRVSRIGLTVSPAERFHGQVDSIVERYPGGNIDATVEITAVGTLGVLAQGTDTLRSPLNRAMDGIADGDIVPVAHWPMDTEQSGATQFANLRDGGPATVTGPVTPGGYSYSGPSGIGSVPTLDTGGQIAGAYPPQVLVADGSGRRVWQDSFVAVIPSTMAADAAFVDINVSDAGGDHVLKWRIEWTDATKLLTARPYNSAGALTGVAINFTGVGVALYDRPVLFSLTVFQTSPGAVIQQQFSAKYPGVSGFVSSGSVGTTTDMPVPQRWRAYGVAANAGWSFSHHALYTDAALFTFPNSTNNAAALDGFDGELAGARMVRLSREEGIAFELVGDEADTPPMGPQLTDTLIANLRDCEMSDHGLMHDNGTDGAIVHVTRRHLYDQIATVAVTRGSLEPNLDAIRDRQYTRNDITSSRPGGGSARVADGDHVAKIRARIKDSRSVNLHTDEQLRMDAGWAVHLGTAPGARYNSVGVNLRNPDGALLADQVAAHAIGDRFTVATTALPPQHIDGIDGLTVGWTELLDSDTWRFRANLMPYGPYDVAKYDTDGDRYDSAYTTTVEDLDTTETGVDVVAAEDKLPWITGSTGPVFPLDIGIGGEQIAVSAIGSLLNDPFTRSVSGGWGTAPTGQVYALSGTASEYNVLATFARMSLVTIGDMHIARADIGSADVRLLASVIVPIVPSGGGITCRIAGRMADTSNFYQAQLLFGTTGSVALQMFKTVAGAGSSISSAFTVGTHSAGNQWWIKLSCSGTSIKARAWKNGATEPPWWQVEATDSSLTSGTNVACLARRETGSTDGTVNAEWDNLQTLTPQRFTVQRSRNGVVKTHAAGAQVRLWSPPAYGY